MGGCKDAGCYNNASFTSSCWYLPNEATTQPWQRCADFPLRGVAQAGVAALNNSAFLLCGGQQWVRLRNNRRCAAASNLY